MRYRIIRYVHIDGLQTKGPDPRVKHLYLLRSAKSHRSDVVVKLYNSELFALYDVFGCFRFEFHQRTASM